MTFLPYLILFLGAFHTGISVHSSAEDESSARGPTSPHAIYPREAEPTHNINLEPASTEGVNRTPENPPQVIHHQVFDINGNPLPEA